MIHDFWFITQCVVPLRYLWSVMYGKISTHFSKGTFAQPYNNTLIALAGTPSLHCEIFDVQHLNITQSCNNCFNMQVKYG